MSLTKLYTALVTTDVALPGELQTAIAVWCQAGNGRDNIFADLVRRTDLDPAVDEMAAASDKAKVKSAWLSRPGRSAEELTTLIKAEKRASVLIAVAESDNTTPELLEAMARDPRITVAEAVVRSSRANDAALLAVLPRILSKPRTHAIASVAGRLLRERPDLHNRLARTVNEDGAVHLVGTPGLDDVAIKRLIKVLVEEPFKKSLELVRQDPTRLARGARFYRDPLTTRLGNALRRAASLIASPNCNTAMVRNSANLWFDIVTAAGEHHTDLPDITSDTFLWFNAARGDAEAIAILERSCKDRYDTIVEAKTTTDAERITLLCQQLVRNSDTEILDALLINPAVQASMLPTDYTGLNDKLAAFLMPLLERSTDPSSDRSLVDLGAHVVTRSPTPETALAQINGHDRVFADAVLARAANEIAPWRLTRLLNDDRYADVIAANLGMAALASLLELNPEMASKLVPLLVSRFGTDRSAWETFHSLADDFTGSVNELVDAAAALVG
jgi:hypothetical protein